MRPLSDITAMSFAGALQRRHQALCLDHQPEALLHGWGDGQEGWRISPQAVVQAFAHVQAACALRRDHGDGVAALLWCIPAWTDDEIGALVRHPDVRADPLTLQGFVQALHARRAPFPELVELGLPQHSTFEAIDRANRALTKVGLHVPRMATLGEHLQDLLLAWEDRHAQTFMGMMPSLRHDVSVPLVERLASVMLHPGCQRACQETLAHVLRSFAEVSILSPVDRIETRLR